MAATRALGRPAHFQARRHACPAAVTSGGRLRSDGLRGGLRLGEGDRSSRRSRKTQPSRGPGVKSSCSAPVVSPRGWAGCMAMTALVPSPVVVTVRLAVAPWDEMMPRYGRFCYCSR